MTSEELAKVNSEISKVDIKGKQYAMVKDRVAAFRQICPNGAIETEIVSHNNGAIIMKAVIKDGDNVLATGTAWEKESNGYINKTSYIENCETSCIGRALGFVGIGIDDSMASAEEVANAILNQNKSTERKAQQASENKNSEKISDEIITGLKVLCGKLKAPESYLCELFSVKDLSEIEFDRYDRNKTRIEKELIKRVNENKGQA